eukprot:TRINITY_DN17729_c1_g1_i1.p2 TRINITY_DN17729_c1_g1~~TRINITY_DN17729_c1_g1_i1.p2  ORF type:complete len:101 (+),score=2.40 TRINITY_DN17729_c1_g1_i1:263-565(+)
MSFPTPSHCSRGILQLICLMLHAMHEMQCTTTPNLSVAKNYRQILLNSATLIKFHVILLSCLGENYSFLLASRQQIASENIGRYAIRMCAKFHAILLSGL